MICMPMILQLKCLVKTKNFAQKIIDSNFSNFVGKEIDVLDKS